MGRLRGPRSSSKSVAGGVKGATNATRGGSNAGYGDGDVAKLKEAIQTLCQSTNPLGERAEGRGCIHCVNSDLNKCTRGGGDHGAPLLANFHSSMHFHICSNVLSRWGKPDIRHTTPTETTFLPSSAVSSSFC